MDAADEVMAEIDAIDRGIARLLQENGRLSLAEIGKILEIPLSTANDRLKRLMRNGVIQGFHARVNPEAFGLDLLAFVFVGWSDSATEAVFLDTILKSGRILECHHVTGAWNYMLKVRARSTRDLEAFLTELKAISGLSRTETLIVLSSAKETNGLGI